MTKILDGRVVAAEIKKDLKGFFGRPEYEGKYVGIFLFGDDKASHVYDRMKRKFANEIGLDAFIFGNNEFASEIDDSRFAFNKTDFTKVENVFNAIKALNEDENCLGIMVQLPLPFYLAEYKAEILSKISPLKDFDGLGGVLIGLSSADCIDFTCATPASVINILEYHGYGDFKGKNVTVVGQSNLVGKPLALEFIKRGAEVFTFNGAADQEIMKSICKKSDIIISATGVVHLIGEGHIRKDNSQVLVDVGWGYLEDGTPAGDIDYYGLFDSVAAITPVPGGVGPGTVASLFDNLKKLCEQKEKLSKLLS